MAEGYLKSLDIKLEVYSAGTNPANEVHPVAVEVMKEKGIDISNNYPKDVDGLMHLDFDYVITVCNNAKETCPVFTGIVGQNLHIGFDDPAKAEGTDEEIKSEFRRISDEINKDFKLFYIHQIKNKHGEKY